MVWRVNVLIPFQDHVSKKEIISGFFHVPSHAVEISEPAIMTNEALVLITSSRSCPHNVDYTLDYAQNLPFPYSSGANF